MTMISIRIEGFDELKRAFSRYPNRVAKALATALEEAGFIIEARAKVALTRGPTRAIDTGYLRDTTRFYRFEPGRLKAEVYSIAEYAIYVHEGLATHSTIGPRRYMQVAAEKSRRDVQAAFDDAVAKALNQ